MNYNDGNSSKRYNIGMPPMIDSSDFLQVFQFYFKYFLERSKSIFSTEIEQWKQG